MITLTINNQKIEVPDGTTVLQAAQQLGIAIPTMCHQEGFEPSTSCMVCAVEIEGSKSLVPSCGMPAEEGMAVRTDTEKVRQARRAALELLLSDHIGDCEGPCRLGCPANMDIPQMLRQISAGDFSQAIETIKQDIALPAVLGRICPAPCEKVCRRTTQDSAVSICLLKRFAADTDLNCSSPYRPACRASSGKKVAVVGAGPCGLSAAYYLAQDGHHCVIFDKSDRPGGMLRCEELKAKLPAEILDQEINLVLALRKHSGRNFRLMTCSAIMTRCFWRSVTRPITVRLPCRWRCGKKKSGPTARLIKLPWKEFLQAAGRSAAVGYAFGRLRTERKPRPRSANSSPARP